MNPQRSRESRNPLQPLRRRVRWLSLCWGIGWTITLTLGTVLALGVLDNWLRFEDPAWRWLLSLGCVLTLGLAVWHTCWLPLHASLSDVWLAQQLERRYPQLRGRLSSILAFREAGFPPSWGSPSWQRCQVTWAEEQLATLDWQRALTVKPVLIVLATGILLVTCTLGIMWTYPAEAAVAGLRLLFPWHPLPWPKHTELIWTAEDGTPLDWEPDEPIRRAIGETLQVYVANRRGRLPHPLWLERLPHPDAPLRREMLPRLKRDAQRQPERAEVVLTAEPVLQRFRVVGGDDDTMPWFALQGVHPPALQTWSIRIIPPDYTGLAPQTLPEGSTQIAGWLGSVVQFSARANRPLDSVRLMTRHQPPQPLTVGHDRTAFTCEVVLQELEPRPIWFELRDAEGFTERQPLQFELRGLLDQPPQVRLTAPATDLTVTPQALVPLSCEMRDDLGVVSLHLAWQHNDTDQQERPLHQWAPPLIEGNWSGAWPVADEHLQPGDRVIFRLEANDAYNLGTPRRGRSAPRVLFVVSPTEKTTELQQATSELLIELHELLQHQQQLEQLAQELLTQWHTTHLLRPSDREALQRLELDQRHLAEQLADSEQSLQARATHLQQQFSLNRLEDELTPQQLGHLAHELQEVVRRYMPSIQRSLTQALKLAHPSPEEPRAATSPSTADNQPQDSREQAAQALAQAAQQQTALTEALNALHHDLQSWLDQHQVQRELQLWAQEQQHLLTETAEWSQHVQGLSPAELSPQQRADLQKLSDRQRRLAQRMLAAQQTWRQQMDTLSSPDTPLRETLDRIDTTHLPSLAQQAAQELSDLRLPQALDWQQQLLEALHQVREPWEERVSDAALRLEQLTQLLQQTREQLEQLNLWREQAIQQPEPFGAAMETMRQQTRHWEQQLRRLELQEPAEDARRLAAMQRGFQQQPPAPDDPAWQHARQQLESIQHSLQQAVQQARDQLAWESYARLVDALQALAVRQRAACDESRRLQQEQLKRGQWSRGQLRSLQQLTREQQALAAEVAQQAQEWRAAAVLFSLLQRTHQIQLKAAERLEQRDPSSPTQQLQERAARLLEQAVDAWRQTASDAQSAPEQSSDSGPSRASGPPGETFTLWQQLQLLYQWQAECAQQTAAWHQAHPDPSQTSVEAWELLDQLAEEQAELLRLLQQLRAQLPSAPPTSPAEPEHQPSPPPTMSLRSRSSQLPYTSHQSQGEAGQDSAASPPSAGTPVEEAPRAPLGEIQQAMARATEELRQRRAGEPTQQAQREALRLLADLLLQARQQMSENASARSTAQEVTPHEAPSSASGPSTTQLDPRRQPQPGSDPCALPQAADATEQPGRAPLPAELARSRLRKLETDVWGHLPPGLREKLLNAYSEKTVPQYEHLIRKFYEALSDPHPSR
ncbi:MAG: hypothetical protein KatS3mg114_1003 [Planctomycetaceae bacterium]|nr:MAG: hypothetical protein KatS3mg114_1003 [Planctomycetaceae bacterium]